MAREAECPVRKVVEVNYIPAETDLVLGVSNRYNDQHNRIDGFKMLIGRLIQFLVLTFLFSALSHAAEFTRRPIDWKLFQAVEFGLDVETLLKEGADPDAEVLANVNSLKVGETPFILALQRARLEVIDTLIRYRKSQAKVPPEFQLDLFASAMNTRQNGNPNYSADRIRLLLKYGLDINTIVPEPKRQWRTSHDDKSPLMYATSTGKIEIVKLLLENGADINLKDKEGRTALSFAKEPEVAKLLMAKGAIGGFGGNDGKKGLFDAILRGRADVIATILDSPSKPPKEVLNEALLRASGVTRQTTDTKAHAASAATLEALLKAGADANFQPEKGGARGAPLLEAVYASNRPAVRLLLSAGADPKRALNNNGGSLMALSIQQEDPEIVKMLWPHYQPMDEKLKNELISIAGSYGKPESVHMLASLGFKLAMGSKESSEVLYRAVDRGDLGTVSVLLEQGADPNQLVWESHNILAMAVQRGHFEIVKKLVAKGAAINLPTRNAYQETPMRAAVGTANLEIFHFLRDHGGKLKAEQPEQSLLHALPGYTGHYGHKTETEYVAGVITILDELVKAGNPIDAVDQEGQTILKKFAPQAIPKLLQAVIDRRANVNFVSPRCKDVAPTKTPVEPISRDRDAGAARAKNRERAAISPEVLMNIACTTPLLAAVSAGNMESTRLLLQAKAKVNQASLFNGHTPLMAAAMVGNPDVVKLLLESRADPKLKNFAGQTAAEIAHVRENSRAQALLEAAAKKK